MRIGRIALALLTLTGLLLAGGVSAFCMPASHGVMKCCKPAKACGPGMKRPECCRFVPASTGQGPAGVETSSPAKISRDEMKGAALAENAQVLFLQEGVEPQVSPPPIPGRGLSVPIYLLNTSLLR